MTGLAEGLSCPEKDRCNNYSLGGGFLRALREWISGFHDWLRTRPSSLFMLFQWGPSKGWIASTWHPTSLSWYTLSLFYLHHPPTVIGRFLAYCLSPRLTTQALTPIYLDPFVLGSLIPDGGGSMHLWNVGWHSFYTAVYPRRQLWTSRSRHCLSFAENVFEQSHIQWMGWRSENLHCQVRRPLTSRA
jgi:hypothetical protein